MTLKKVSDSKLTDFNHVPSIEPSKKHTIPTTTP
jgi:hypothetical protein